MTGVLLVATPIPKEWGELVISHLGGFKKKLAAHTICQDQKYPNCPDHMHFARMAD